MLAVAPLPRGSGADLAVVSTLSEGFERFVASPLDLVGYVRWDVRSDRFLLFRQSFQQLFQVALRVADQASKITITSEFQYQREMSAERVPPRHSTATVPTRVH